LAAAGLALAAAAWLSGLARDRLVEPPQTRRTDLLSIAIRRYEDPRPLQGSLTLDAEGWFFTACGLPGGTLTFGLSFANQATADRFFAEAARLGSPAGAGAGLYARFTGQVYHYKTLSLTDPDGSRHSGLNVILHELLELRPGPRACPRETSRLNHGNMALFSAGNLTYMQSHDLETWL
jgi:hypothetical protein